MRTIDSHAGFPGLSDYQDDYSIIMMFQAEPLDR
jgi:hypothetical protein